MDIFIGVDSCAGEDEDHMLGRLDRCVDAMRQRSMDTQAKPMVPPRLSREMFRHLQGEEGMFAAVRRV